MGVATEDNMARQQHITTEARDTFRSHRAHGASVKQAARAAGLTEDAGYQIEGRTYCDQCGGYVTSTECPHWEY